MSNVVNPPIPYVGAIPGGFRHGRMVTIQGKVPHHHERFSVNLCFGPQVSPLGDTALHFNPRFGDHCVVRNHQSSGSWGNEERGGGFPFQHGQHFTIVMLSEHNHYKVSVNGIHFCEFRHRLDNHRVQYLIVEGGVKVDYINFDGGAGPGAPPPIATCPMPQPVLQPMPQPGLQPMPQPGLQPMPQPPAPPGSMSRHAGGFAFNITKSIIKGVEAAFHEPPRPRHPRHPRQPHPARYPPPSTTPQYPPAGGAYPAPPGQPIFNPPVPFTTPIQGGLYNGRIISISGIPRAGGQRFHVNVQCGPYDSDANDIALHFDVRFNYGSDQNVVVRNSCSGGGWGSEERQMTYFPFMQNVNFDMMILVEQSSFKVAVNNQHFIEFYHRIQPFNRADTLKVEGDVTLTQIRIQ